MTDQEKKELRDAIEIVKTLALSEDFDIDREKVEMIIIKAAKKLREKAEMIIIKAAKKLLDASENLADIKNNYSHAIFDEGFSQCLDRCTATVATHYVSKKDLPSEEEIYDELMATFINSDIDDVPDGLLEKAAKAIHDRIIGGK